MEITTNTSITITINGQNYTFADQHPIVDLISEMNNETDSLNFFNGSAAACRTRIADLQSQIQALCITPV